MPNETPKSNAAAVMALAAQTADPLYQECQRLERQVSLLVDQLTECAGLMAAVDLERRHRDIHGNLFLNQTLDWGKGCAAVAAKANALLEAYDEGTLGKDA